MTIGRGLRALAGSTMLAGAVVALLMFAEVSAARTTFTFPAGTSPIFTLKGSKGYSITISGSAGFLLGGKHVTFTVTKGRSSASYSTTSGTFSATTMRGGISGFGGSGKVDVHFVQTGKAKSKSLSPGCTGDKDKVRPGFFHGTIIFRGEHGYTRLTAHRAKGKVIKSGEQTCTFPDPASGSTVLSASKTFGDGGLTFSATKVAKGSKVTYSAASFGTSGSAQIYRSVSATGPPDSFLHFGGLTTATVHPPTPFHGNAHLAGGAWQGPLTVGFPGKGSVRLTGTGFTATLSKTP